MPGATPPCLAGGNQMFDEHGVGPRDAAMGNAFTALADDYSAAFYNPAGFSYIRGNHFDIGYKGVYPDLYMNLTPDPGRDLSGGFPADFLLVGLSTDFDFSDAINKNVSDRFSAGLALAISAYFKSFTLFADPNTPYFFRYRDRPVSILSLYAGFAIKVFDWASFGARINVAPSDTHSDVIAHSDIEMPVIRWETRQGMATASYSKVEPVLGAMFLIPAHGRSDGVRVGMAWHDEVTTLDGSGEFTNVVRITLSETGEQIEVPKTTVDMHQLTGFSPMSATLGFAWKPTDAVTVTADGIWRNWSAWLTGAENKPSPPFLDTYHARLGFQHAFDIDWEWVFGITARAGYYYEPSPTQSMNGYMNILDPDKHVAATGAGFLFNDPMGIFLLPVRFDLVYQLHYLMDSHLDNDREDVFGPIDYGGQIHSFAATFGVEY